MAQTRTKTTLSQSHPELAAQWHPTKNGSITPDAVFGGSHKRIWWQCPDGPGDLEEIIQAVRDKVPPRSSIPPKEKARLLVSRSSCGCKVSHLC